MSDYNARLADYVDVKERIRLFYEQHPDGRLTTAEVTIHTDPDGEQRVMVKALAYRTPDDPVPGAGHSWMVLPGSTPYTKGSEVENTETSAWGRAIGSLGIGIDKSIASGDEVRGKAGETDAVEENESDDDVTLALLGRIQKSGKAVKGTAERFKGEWFSEEAGHAIGFRFKLEGEKKDIPQVKVMGAYGEALFLGHPDFLGTRITIKGHLYNVVPKRRDRRSYYRLVVGERPEHEFIETEQLRIPAVSPLREGEPESIPVAEGQEPLFETAKLDPEERLLVGGAG